MGGGEFGAEACSLASDKIEFVSTRNTSVLASIDYTWLHLTLICQCGLRQFSIAQPQIIQAKLWGNCSSIYV